MLFKAVFHIADELQILGEAFRTQSQMSINYNLNAEKLVEDMKPV